MTETLPAQAFKAKFQQTDTMPGSTVLSMELTFRPTGDGDWQASGTAEVVRGSTHPPLELAFPVAGTLLVEATEIMPPSYALHVHSHFPDGRLGTSLDVKLVTRSATPPPAAAELTFTGEYTWMAGEPVTVPATVEMVNENAD
ncbi:MAG TPA: hypothetical protein VFU36_07660 [Jatrophihabitans sp.]|nr:hypothetical protein [Jatrophihabitans sp.]